MQRATLLIVDDSSNSGLKERLSNRPQWAVVVATASAESVDAVNMGNPVYLSARNSPLSKKIEELARKVLSDDDRPARLPSALSSSAVGSY